MAPTVVLLPPQEWEAAGEMLARAFAADPLRAAMFPDEATRPALTRVFFQMGLRQLLLSGQVVDTTTSRSAVAAWSPPGQPALPLLWAAVRTAPQGLSRWLRAGSPSDVRRVLGMLARYSRRHAALMPQPHWYLQMLGVDPARQRFGLGAVLVRHGLARADRDGLPAFVEAETERNAAFYGKLGFRPVHYTEAQDDPLGVQVWCLVREPGQTPAREPADRGQ